MKTLRELEQEIRALAYELYERGGKVPGRDLEDWFEAEKIVMSKYTEIERLAGNAEAGGVAPQVPRQRKRTSGGGRSRKKIG